MSAALFDDASPLAFFPHTAAPAAAAPLSLAQLEQLAQPEGLDAAAFSLFGGSVPPTAADSQLLPLLPEPAFALDEAQLEALLHSLPEPPSHQLELSSTPLDLSAALAAFTAPNTNKVMPISPTPSAATTAIVPAARPKRTAAAAPSRRRRGPDSDSRKSRHKQTEEARRKRLNGLIEELRDLLQLDPAAHDKAAVLEQAKLRLSVLLPAPAVASPLPTVPGLVYMVICITDYTVVEANAEYFRQMGLLGAKLPLSLLPYKVHEDVPYLEEAVKHLRQGLVQSLQVCKRFRTARGDYLWGRYTLMQPTASGGRLYTVSVGRFLSKDDPVPSHPYCIV